MTIDTDRLRAAFTMLAEPLPGYSPRAWADLKKLANAAIDAADEIDRLRALLTEARNELAAWHKAHWSINPDTERMIDRIDVALGTVQIAFGADGSCKTTFTGGRCATCNGTGNGTWNRGDGLPVCTTCGGAGR